jgi:acyl-CoA synthetase (AMP-forming)/AMP-acid ligase II
VRVVGYGGMPMPAPTARRLAERFGDLATGFGQSETTLLVTALSIADHRRAMDGEEHLLESCGRPIGLAAIDVLDDDSQPCPPGEVGELCVRSDLTMSGYWNNPEGTASAFAGGWLHTGDLVRRDDDGYVYIVDRKKDLVISGGQNIYPTEVERVIYQLPGVAEAAVVGVPDPVWGESLTAVVVARSGIPITADEIIDHCRDNLASYKKPKRVVFLDELPKNVTGKILKRELRATLAR